MPLVGDLVREPWRVIDLNAATVNGLTIANFNVDLTRGDSVAPEAVTLAAVGDGVYVFKFTPLAAATYSLAVQELSNFANSAQSGFIRSIIVTSAGATFAASYANAFCAETDIERHLGRSVDATTTPSDTAVSAWAEEIASEITTACQLAGLRITPSGGDAPLTATGTGVQLEDMLREANAIGVCMRVEAASYLGAPPNDSARAGYFKEEYIKLIGGDIVSALGGTITKVQGMIPAFIEAEVGTALKATNHLHHKAPTLIFGPNTLW